MDSTSSLKTASACRSSLSCWSIGLLYEPAWDRDDATIARARCLEARGKYLDAVHVLQDLFHRLATQEREAGLDDAEGVLERIRGYGIDPSSYSNLTDRYDALTAQESEAAPSPRGRATTDRESSCRRRRGATSARRGYGPPKAAGIPIHTSA